MSYVQMSVKTREEIQSGRISDTAGRRHLAAAAASSDVTVFRHHKPEEESIGHSADSQPLRPPTAIGSCVERLTSYF